MSSMTDGQCSVVNQAMPITGLKEALDCHNHSIAVEYGSLYYLPGAECTRGGVLAGLGYPHQDDPTQEVIR